MEKTLANIILRAATIVDKKDNDIRPKMVLREACEQAAKELNHPKLARLVYLAMDSWWNDALDWAEECK